MKFSIDKQEKHLVFKLQEEKLDSTFSPNIKSEFVTLNAEGHGNIVFDLSETKYIDSSGLSAILVANRLCDNLGGKLALAGVNDHVMKLFKISQLDSVIIILPTVEEAIDSIFMHQIEKELTKEESKDA
jgi:anti-sigma B factor antagonist